jgi:hypothetical protein
MIPYKSGQNIHFIDAWQPLVLTVTKDTINWWILKGTLRDEWYDRYCVHFKKN